MTTQTVATSSEHLRALVDAEIVLHGTQCNLNHLDISRIDSLYAVFQDSPFNGDISQWDTAHITDMSGLFLNSKFKGDISSWDTGHLVSAVSMFRGSEFNGDISQWNTKNLFVAYYMFRDSHFNGDISNWNVSKTYAMSKMFQDSAFEGDLSKWDLSGPRETAGMFFNCPTKTDFSSKILSHYGKRLRMFSSTFEGRLPQAPEDTPNYKKFYTTLFGDLANLRSYLERVPFGSAHMDLLQEAKKTPTWSNPTEHDWARKQMALGESLGLDRAALVHFVVGAHPSNRPVVKEVDDIALDTFSTSP